MTLDEFLSGRGGNMPGLFLRCAATGDDVRGDADRGRGHRFECRSRVDPPVQGHALILPRDILIPRPLIQEWLERVP